MLLIYFIIIKSYIVKFKFRYIKIINFDIPYKIFYNPYFDTYILK